MNPRTDVYAPDLDPLPPHPPYYAEAEGDPPG